MTIHWSTRINIRIVKHVFKFLQRKKTRKSKSLKLLSEKSVSFQDQRNQLYQMNIDSLNMAKKKLKGWNLKSSFYLDRIQYHQRQSNSPVSSFSWITTKLMEIRNFAITSLPKGTYAYKLPQKIASNTIFLAFSLLR